MPEHKHYALHKPYGYLSMFIYNGKRKKRVLGELYDFIEGTMAIGRLDEKSEGLLLLTTDGMVSHLVRSKKVEKEYYVQLDGIVTDEAINLLQRGVEIGFDGLKYTTLPCNAHKVENPNIPQVQRIRDDRHGPTSWASITVTEGKFRQVRKMGAAVGFPVLRLIRMRIGEIYLNDLKAGEVLEINTL
jgi:23S rRNA pseudouridine2457 synthase